MGGILWLSMMLSSSVQVRLAVRWPTVCVGRRIFRCIWSKRVLTMSSLAHSLHSERGPRGWSCGADASARLDSSRWAGDPFAHSYPDPVRRSRTQHEYLYGTVCGLGGLLPVCGRVSRAGNLPVQALSRRGTVRDLTVSALECEARK